MNRRVLQGSIAGGKTMPFIGVSDAYSGSVAARHFDGLFVSRVARTGAGCVAGWVAK
jgi:hypothetical protein